MPLLDHPAQVGTAVPVVFSAREIARAAGVEVRDVEALAAAGAIRTLPGGYVPQSDAVRAVRALRKERQRLFSPASSPATPHRHVVPLALSDTLHAGMVGVIAVLTTLGLVDARAKPAAERHAPIRLVYLVQPGPGGGGGGGGRLQLAAPPRARRRTPAPTPKPKISVPVPPRRPPPPPVVAAPQPVEPPKPPPRPEPAPQVVAPVASVPADDRHRPGVLEESVSSRDSHGAGTGGGAGTGSGTGMGEGDGPGIGPGSGGGTGGGPYRPGSGIEPPKLLREIRPDYTEEARRRGIEGDVVLEIVVRRDGLVGGIRVVDRLGAGLDERAVEAVRQWRFAPARRLGAPVDVIVEVAVEFRLR